MGDPVIRAQKGSSTVAYEILGNWKRETKLSLSVIDLGMCNPYAMQGGVIMPS